MADYVVTGPDGARYKVTAPDSMPMDDVLARFRREHGGAQAPTAPAAETPPVPAEPAPRSIRVGEPPSVPGAGMPSIPGISMPAVTATPDGEYLVGTPNKGATQTGAPSQAADVALSGLSGVARALIGIPGIPGNLEWIARRGAEVTSQMGGGQAPTGQPETLGGTPQAPAPASSVSTLLPTSADVIAAAEDAGVPLHRPETTAGAYAQTIGEFAPSALFPTRATGLPAQLATRIGGNVAAPALASEGLGQALEGTSGETTGRVVGALLAPYLPRAAMRAVTPLPASARRLDAAAVLDAEGVPLTAGQRSGSRPLMYAESAAQDMPFVGGRIADTVDGQGVAFTQAAMRRVDEAGGTIQPGVVATPQWLAQQRARIGAQFDALTAGHDIILAGRGGGAARGRTLEAAALRLEADYNALVPEALQRNPLVHDLVDDIANAVAQGRIDGAAYQSYRSRFSRMSAQHSDPEFQRFIGGLREALDNAMESGIPAAAREAWQQARREWRHFLVLEDAAASAGADAALGIISPQALARAAKSGNRQGYAEDRAPFSDIGHAGSAAMERLPNSGTPGRLAAMYGVPAALASAAGSVGDFASGTPGAFSGAGMAGVLLPPLTARAITSGPAQAWLGNQTLAAPLNAMGRASPGIVSRALVLPWQQPELLGERPPRPRPFRSVVDALTQ